jgi:hypothetical protein
MFYRVCFLSSSDGDERYKSKLAITLFATPFAPIACNFDAPEFE